MILTIVLISELYAYIVVQKPVFVKRFFQKSVFWGKEGKSMQKSAYERYCYIRDKRGYKDIAVANGAGITKSTLSDWKAGRYIPKQEKMQKIADFLGVSLEYLMNGSDTSETAPRYYLNDETAAIAQDIFENKELRLLFDAARDAQPEDLETVHSMLLALKRKERGNVD